MDVERMPKVAAIAISEAELISSSSPSHENSLAKSRQANGARLLKLKVSQVLCTGLEAIHTNLQRFMTSDQTSKDVNGIAFYLKATEQPATSKPASLHPLHSRS